MVDWTGLSGLSGGGSVVAVSLAMLGSGDYNCPMSNAMRARRLYPENRPPDEVLEDFSNGFIMDELDRRDAESSGGHWTAPARRGVAHEGVEAWTQHALAQYDSAFPVEADEVPLIAARFPWRLERKLNQPDHRGVKIYRVTLWGRCLQSVDGAYREFRWPSNRLERGEERRRSAAERAVAAMITAWSPPGPAPRRVRVIEFGFLDGRPDPTPLFDGTPQEARELYEAEGKDVLTAVVDGHVFNPGKACTSCRFTANCPKVPKTDGLLQIQALDRPLRMWSPTSARSYRECPARAYLRSHKLPVDMSIEHATAADRGRAVHKYLAECHKSVPHRPCGLVIPEDWAGTHALDHDQYALSIELLCFHAEVCPMSHVVSPEGIQVEPMLVYEDAAASSLVLVQPDLLYLDGGSWVWREVKTASRRRRFEDLFRYYPQLAVGVELLGRGELGGTRARSRVELEILRPGGADLLTFDPLTPAIRHAAREALREAVVPWRADDRFTASPGHQCASCEVARWCPSRQTGDGPTGEPR